MDTESRSVEGRSEGEANMSDAELATEVNRRVLDAFDSLQNMIAARTESLVRRGLNPESDPDLQEVTKLGDVLEMKLRAFEAEIDDVVGQIEEYKQHWQEDEAAIKEGHEE